MKKTTIALLLFATFSANAAYEQAHDPHVTNPVGQICKVGSGSVDPTTPDTDKPDPVDPDPKPPVDPGELVNPNGYYTAAMDKSGVELKTALNTIISEPHIKLPYSSTSFDVWDALRQADEDPNNSSNVLLLYTGRSQNKDTQDGSSGGTNGDQWNREHVWPKSQGGFNDKTAYGYTDIHHLRPADENMNSERGQLQYAEGGSATKDSPSVGNLKDTGANSFEPRDAVKGDVARMIFYMATRYEGSDTKTPDLEIVVGTTTESSRFGDLCTLLKWNAQDPVDKLEKDRHEQLFSIQKNRNPYIDNPQWVNNVYDNGECK